MAVLYSVIIFGSILTACVTCFVITEEDPGLPTQYILNDNSFMRIHPNNRQQIIHCPVGTLLDKTSLTCEFESTDTPLTPVVPTSDTLCFNVTGDIMNPESCRHFISCGAAGSFSIICPANLLFNVATDSCDWPRKAECCEYSENNSSRFLQNSD